MGACGNKQSALTDSVIKFNPKGNKDNKDNKDNKENKDDEMLNLEQRKINELKRKNAIKGETKSSNNALGNSNAQKTDLKINYDLFGKQINIYEDPGKPHPPFETINKQLEVSLCRITNKNNKVGIGFLCIIPFPTFHYSLPVLITNNNVLEKNEISPGKKINITLNSKQKIEILLDDSRKIYNKNEIIIIEINENDGLDIDHFFKFANINNVDEYKKIYSPQNSYFFRYSKNDKIDCCQGLLQNIDKYNYKFMFIVDPVNESSGSPIISYEHNVIGIHMNEMKGVFLLEHLREFYEMESIKKNPKDEITIIYQIIKESDTKINIFGKDFVKNNKDKCKIIINGNEQELVQCLDKQNYADIFNFEGKYTEISIKLKGINDITSTSYMFKNCTALIALPDLGKWDINKISIMGGMFLECSNLIHISNNISKWNTSNLVSILEMFAKCINLMYLPEISKWNTHNLKIMEDLFHSCQNLKEVPDISNWNIENVGSLKFIFADCKCLTSLPDISKWNINKLTDFIGIFEQCESLRNLPDISKWNTNKITNLDRIFNNCKSLTVLPDISKWNTNKVTSMRLIFKSCISLQTLPDISKWNTDKVNTMEGMFDSCTSLIMLPDISKWNTSNVTNMVKLFNMCEKLESFPNISTWDTSKVTENKYMYNSCFAALLFLENMKK